MTGHRYTTTELRILVEVYQEPYTYARDVLYERVPATRDEIDDAIDHLVAAGDIRYGSSGRDDLMLTTRRTRERGRRMDRRWARRAHAAKQKARRAKQGT